VWTATIVLDGPVEDSIDGLPRERGDGADVVALTHAEKSFTRNSERDAANQIAACSKR